MNERPLLSSGCVTSNDRMWVKGPLVAKQRPKYTASREHGQKDTIVIIEHFAPDAYGLLILEPEIALGSGWLGGDRVVGRAAIRDLRIKAARFTEHERKRLTVHLPSRALTLRLDEIERYYEA